MTLSRFASGTGAMAALGGDTSVVVCGTVHPRPVDRVRPRCEIAAVQGLVDGVWVRHPVLAGLGERGVNALAALPDRRSWLCTTGFELYRYDSAARMAVQLDAITLDDAHDICVDHGIVRIANSGADEVVSFPADRPDEAHHGRLQAGRSPSPVARWLPEIPAGGLVQVRDRFHVNQVFRTWDGQLAATVHNVDGLQVLIHKGLEVLKAHGNGGVIDLRTGRPLVTGLSSPHSVTLLPDGFAIFDSGATVVRVYDVDWRERGCFPTVAWGRGAELTPDGCVLVAGMSPIRKRYARRIPMVSPDLPACVQFFDTATFESLGTLEVPDVEEVYDVKVVSRHQAEAFLGIASTEHAPGPIARAGLTGASC